MPIVDVHTHMFTKRWLELLRTSGDPYGVVVRPDGRDEIYRGPTPVVFPSPATSTTAFGSSRWTRRGSTSRSCR